MDTNYPHSIEAERAVLGAVLLRNDVMAQLVLDTPLDVFYRDAHRKLYAVFSALFRESRPIDMITVCDVLRISNHLDAVGGPAYIASLVDGVPKTSNVDHYSAILREKARLRGCLAVAHRVTEAVQNGEDCAAHIIERSVAELSLLAPTDGTGPSSVDDAIQEYVSAIIGGSLPPPIPTGYLDLDQLIDGFIPGDLVIIAARPSTGKTAFCIGVGDHMAVSNNAVAFFSLEMSKQGIAARVLSQRTRIQAKRITTEAINDEEGQRLANALNGERVPFYIDATVSTTTQITAAIRLLKSQNIDIKVAIVDYLQMLSPERLRQSDQAEIAGISRALKRLATDERIVVVALSQLSRATESRRDKRPQLSDLRGSGALEQDADIGILLFRPEMYDRTEENVGISEIIVAKNRNGPTGVVRLAFIEELARFENLEWR